MAWVPELPPQILWASVPAPVGVLLPFLDTETSGIFIRYHDVHIQEDRLLQVLSIDKTSQEILVQRDNQYIRLGYYPSSSTVTLHSIQADRTEFKNQFGELVLEITANHVRFYKPIEYVYQGPEDTNQFLDNWKKATKKSILPLPEIDLGE